MTTTKNYKEILIDFYNHEDGTYTLDGERVQFIDGYQVSFCKEGSEHLISKSNMENAILPLIASYDLADKNMYVGVYNGKPEFSFHFSNLFNALKFGALYQQHSIWVWENDCEHVIDYDMVNNLTSLIDVFRDDDDDDDDCY